MKKNICVVTGTRAEYGIMKRLLTKIEKDLDLNLFLVATGMHLCPEFGLTYEEIEKDGFEIHEKIEVILSSDTNVGMSKSLGLTILSFADYFKKNATDLLIVLGDRYEIFGVATAAAIQQIPIAHISGGDTTEGAIDEFLRHSITKMSYLHFTTTEVYKKRVEQLGENPSRVFNVGSMGVENILRMKLLTKEALEKSIDFKLIRKFGLVTFHPVTMEDQSAAEQFQNLLDALETFDAMDFIFTKANSDANGRVINKMIDKYVENHKNAFGFTSLGLLRYLSAMKYSSLVIGNSSSGIAEAPSFGIATINIGDRQRGRVQAESILNCEPEKEKIIETMKLGLQSDFRNTKNPYEGKEPTLAILETIKGYLFESKVDLKKKFWDLER